MKISNNVVDEIWKICLVIIVFTTQAQSSRDLCDIRTWYLKIISDGVFNIDLTPEKFQLKQNIETLVLNSADGLIDCQSLVVYNVMLNDKFNYKGESISVDDLKEITTRTNIDKKFAGTEKQSGEIVDSPNEEVINENKIGTLQDGKVTNLKDTHQNDHEAIVDKTVSSDQGDTDHAIKENIIHENKEQVAKNKEGNEDLAETENNEELSGVNVKDDEYVDHTEIDETDLFDEESDFTDDEDQIDSSETNGEEHADTDGEADEEFVTRTIPLGICKSFGCLQSDVFDVFEIDEMVNKEQNGEDDGLKDILHDDIKEVNGYLNMEDVTTTIQESQNILDNTRRKTLDDNEEANTNEDEIEQKLSSNTGPFFIDLCFVPGDSCSNVCMYVTLHSFCLIGYELHSKPTESNKSEITPTNKDDNGDSVVDALMKKNDELGNSIKSDDQMKVKDAENSEQIQQFDETLNSEQDTPQQDTPDVKRSDFINSSELGFTEGMPDDLLSERKDDQNDFFSDTGQKLKDATENTKVENKYVFNDFNEVNRKLDEIENENKEKQNTRDSKISVDEFEKIIHETTNQYAQKIQTLEIMIMKLENQVLVEKLNKQNHSSTITRLENLILKLENDFLKLNTQYDEIKTENENMSKRQNHYLEIAYKNQKQTCKQLQLPDKSAKTSELLSQHQSKITELTDILRNQSVIIKAVKDRYNLLEEQNRMLHQMIMNQTIFMTSIIHTLQDLSKQNTKNKEEIQELRQKLASGAAQNSAQKSRQKDNILDAIDKYAHDEKIDVAGNGYGEDENEDDDDENESDRNLKLYLRRKPTEESIAEWCPLNNDTCPSCYYRNVLQVNCIPFRSMFWSSCGASCKQDIISDTKHIQNIISTGANSDNEQQKDRTMSANEKVKIQEDGSDSTSVDHREKEQDVRNIHDNSNRNDVKVQINGKNPIENDNEKNELLRRQETDNYIEQNPDSVKGNSMESIVSNKIERKEKEIIADSKNNNDKKQGNSATINTNTGYKDNLIDKDYDKENNAKVSDKDKKQSNTNRDNTKDTHKKEHNKHENGSTSNRVKSDGDKNIGDNKEKNTNKQSSKKENKQTQDTKTDNMKSKKADPTQEKINKSDGKNKRIPVNMDKKKPDTPKDCYDYYKRGNRNDGIYKINPIGLDRMIEVFCDMRKGGWTVIQRRQDGTMKFFREWKEYKKGFGGLYGEHWLGNENLHFLTNQEYYKLRVDLMDWDKNKKYAEYNYFLVESEDDGYRINIDGYTGDAGDGLSKHHGHKFSTKDVDNDKVVKEFGGSCAVRFHGAGWYYKCYASNLNGKYYKGGKIPEKKYDGVTWKPWTGPNYSLKKVEMKIKPANNK